jgi:hypothetical protein
MLCNFKLNRTEARRLVALKYLTSDTEPSDPNGGDGGGEAESSSNEAEADAEIKPKDEELAFFLGKVFKLDLYI